MPGQCTYCGSSMVVVEENHSSFCKECRRSNVLEASGADDGPHDVCVVGMGYVGSSLAVLLAENDLIVRGVDTNPSIVDTINDGHCPIAEDQITDLFETHAQRGNITATDSYNVVETCDTILITVGTPYTEDDPDLSNVEAASEQVGGRLTEGDLVIFRSTLPAGATEDVIRPILNDESDLIAGDDYALAFCPERMAEGTAYEDLKTLPVVVGGLTPACLSRAERFWEMIGNETVTVSSPRAAELTKLADNWWIDLNIALANELALLSEEVGVDALEVIHAANTLPKGEHNVNILFPGAGVGGSCLVKDPWFVANLGDSHGLDLQTPRVSRRVNTRMPSHVVDLLERGLDGFSGQSVTILGYAFKAETDDTRNTPAREIITKLDGYDLDIRITDPYVNADAVANEVGHTPLRLPEALSGTRAVVTVTGHRQYQDLSANELIDYVGSEEFVVVDGRHVFVPTEFNDSRVRYLGVGRGSNG